MSTGTVSNDVDRTDERGQEAARVQAEAPEGWQAVWLPRHGVFLAFRDVDMPPGVSRPATYGTTPDETLAAIRDHERLTDGVREWVRLHEGDAV